MLEADKAEPNGKEEKEDGGDAPAKGKGRSKGQDKSAGADVQMGADGGEYRVHLAVSWCLYDIDVFACVMLRAIALRAGL